MTFWSFAEAVSLLTLFAGCICAMPFIGAKALLAIEEEAHKHGGFKL